MLEGVAIICDPERFGGDVHMRCPQHESDARWVADVRAAWAWTDAKRNLTDFVREPTAALIDGVALLGREVAARDADARAERDALTGRG